MKLGLGGRGECVLVQYEQTVRRQLAKNEEGKVFRCNMRKHKRVG